MIGQAEATDGLLRETWIEVYRKINRPQRPNAFTVSLYRIARDKDRALQVDLGAINGSSHLGFRTP